MLGLCLCALWSQVVAAQDANNSTIPQRSDLLVEAANTTHVMITNSSDLLPSTHEPTVNNKAILVNVASNASSLVSAHTCGVRDGKSVRKLRIITSSTIEYFPVFMNWLVYFHKICPNIANIYFICLDTAIEKKLPEYGLSCSHVFHVSSSAAVHDIWLVRTRLTATLLNQGYDVLLTDSDALWIHNPFPHIEAHITSDVISSRGSFPDYVSKALGATLCMGFVYIKASEHTVTLWGEIAARMSRASNPDDQREINSYLLSLHLHYKDKPTYIGSTDYNTGYFNHHNHNYAVTLLPHTLFRRICDAEKIGDVKSSVVAHCLTHQKVGAHKQSTAEALGVWLLKDSWDTIALHSDMEAYLDSISIDSESANRRVVRMLMSRTGMQGVRIFSATMQHVQQNTASVSSEVGTARHMRGSLRSVVRTLTERHPMDSNSQGHVYGAQRAGELSSVCYEYHTNRQHFNVSDQACWYVSSAAPEASVREYEQRASE